MGNMRPNLPGSPWPLSACSAWKVISRLAWPWVTRTGSGKMVSVIEGSLTE